MDIDQIFKYVIYWLGYISAIGIFIVMMVVFMEELAGPWARKLARWSLVVTAAMCISMLLIILRTAGYINP